MIKAIELDILWIINYNLILNMNLQNWQWRQVPKSVFFNMADIVSIQISVIFIVFMLLNM